MYRDGKVYDKIKDVIIDIFIDYEVRLINHLNPILLEVYKKSS